jgi:hypothetical protein
VQHSIRGGFKIIKKLNRSTPERPANPGGLYDPGEVCCSASAGDHRTGDPERGGGDGAGVAGNEVLYDSVERCMISARVACGITHSHGIAVHVDERKVCFCPANVACEEYRCALHGPEYRQKAGEGQQLQSSQISRILSHPAQT